MYTGTGLLSTLRPRLERVLDEEARENGGRAELPKRVFVLTSPEIWALWSQSFLASFQEEPIVLFLPAGERHKRLANVEKLARQMAAAGGDRSSLLIAFGGGIVGDVGGFLAAVFMRGIRYVQVPTTFLAQVDSSVGGKTGVNLPEGKNLLGAFYHPLAVFADMDVLATLPDRELKAGLFESVKAGMIRDRSLLRYMEANARELFHRDPKALEKVIAASIRMKADVVGEDERENGPRMILNLGHTLGHAIESVTGYRKLLHGEAVGWGIVGALSLGRNRRTISEAQFERLMALVKLYGPLPALRLNADRLVAATARDKKHLGDVRRFVLPVGLGNACVVEDVTAAELLEATRFMLSMARAKTDGAKSTPDDRHGA
uniref:3-dehydroquinate synthase n=1 Tax=mine drainage metagenome TaxID=410659 RepID=E6PZ11_9ZZZZ